MIIICAWCGKELARDDRKPRDRVSHGMCDECAEKAREEAREWKEG